MIIAHDDERLSWHGQISLETTKEYTRPWRVPFEKKALFFHALVDKAAMPAGVRLAFHSNTESVAGEILPHEKNTSLDLYVDGEFFGRQEMTNKEAFAFADLPKGEKLIELWLPQLGNFALKSLTLGTGATLKPHADKRKRWITYGSSITHCGSAESPSFTWPAIVARERDLNLTSLGFGGQCHLDAQVARMIRDQPADYLSICAGINIYGSSSLNLRSFGPALVGFVQILREKHPETPLALISPIFGTKRETETNRMDLTLVDYRQCVREMAELLLQEGDANVHYVDGLDLLDQTYAHLMPDGLHPNAEGYKIMARNFLDNAATELFGF